MPPHVLPSVVAKRVQGTESRDSARGMHKEELWSSDPRKGVESEEGIRAGREVESGAQLWVLLLMPQGKEVVEKSVDPQNALQRRQDLRCIVGAR